ncbi:MAG: lysostaphin resistance A-like protein [Steroidobacteraceae bacterium]
MIDARPQPSAVFPGLLANRAFRLLVFFVCLAALLVGAEAIPQQFAIRAERSHKLAIVLAGAAIGIPMLLFVYARLVRLLEKRRATELASAGAAPAVAAGIAVGIGLFALVMSILWATGFATVAVAAPFAVPVFAIVAAATAAVAEELLIRGAVFRILEESFGTSVALVTSALIFGGLHGANPGATLLSSCAIALEAGLLLGVAYVATRALWLPIGLHFGWDVCESAIFGSTESGYVFKGFFSTTTSGPDLLTGGSFGPEASIVAVLVCMAAAAVLAMIAVRRGNWKPVTFQINAAR